MTQRTTAALGICRKELDIHSGVGERRGTHDSIEPDGIIATKHRDNHARSHHSTVVGSPRTQARVSGVQRRIT
jgi:hypothetical protein